MSHVFTEAQRAAWLDTLEKRVSSAGIILEDEAGRALIVKATYKDHWTFPGGIIDAGETPKQAALREVYEEVGLAIDERTLEFVGVATRTSLQAVTYHFVFKAPLPEYEKVNIILQESEIGESRFVSRDDVRRSDIHYGKVIENWAADITGYVEQTFGDVK